MMLMLNVTTQNYCHPTLTLALIFGLVGAGTLDRESIYLPISYRTLRLCVVKKE